MSTVNSLTVELSEKNLVSNLNILLAELQLTITLQTPYDLIPSLLLAVLESILELRLPISTDVRESRSPSDKVQAMKMFLGVLENDVLRMDVGLGEVDPRKLAAGEWDEVVFVGELLCWLGKQRGLLPPETVETLRDVEDSSLVPRLRKGHTRAQSPSTRSTVTNTTATNSANTDLSMQSVNNNSDTTIMTDSGSSRGSPSVALGSPLRQPRCIHELDEPSLIVTDGTLDPDQDASLTGPSESFCDCFAEKLAPPPQHTSIRHTGWIDKVDERTELELFEASKVTRDRSRSSGIDSHSGSHSQYPGWAYSVSGFLVFVINWLFIVNSLFSVICQFD
jgi:hypothetical protein